MTSSLSLNYNANRMIIGFNDWFRLDSFQRQGYSRPEDMAYDALKKEPGFLAVVDKFMIINAVLVKIDSSQVDDFVRYVRRLDQVEYCDHDFFLEKSSYETLLQQAHNVGISQGAALSSHVSFRGGTNASSGVGSKIALIDTGMSPHQYLPALSFGEASAKEFTRHRVMQSPKIKSLIDSLAKIEEQFANPYGNHTDWYQFKTILISQINSFFDSEWLDWESKLYQWVSARRSSRSSANPPPRPPHLRAIYGQLRIVSPLSWNFVSDTPNIIDNDGHGTGMAGCISALQPLGNGILPTLSPILATTPATINVPYDEKMRYSENNVVGLSPYSELIILKVMDTRKAENSTLSTLIKALEYCANEIQPDSIYIGLAIKNQKQSDLMSLARAVSKLNSLNPNLSIFAPAGNEGKAELYAPAGFPHVNAITAADVDKNGCLCRQKFSNYANQNLEVSFCASGGLDDLPMHILSNNFGFTFDRGTSISAAVVCAIYSHLIGDQYLQDCENHFRTIVNSHGQISTQIVRAYFDQWQPSDANVKHVFYHMKRNAIHPAGPSSLNQDPNFGWGYPRL